MSSLQMCLPTARRSSLQEEYYSTDTSPVAPAFYDCVIKGHPASRGQGPLSESRLKEIWALGVAAEISGTRPKGRGGSFQIQDLQLFADYKVPLNDRRLSREEKPKNPMERTDYQNFFGPDRMDTSAYHLGWGRSVNGKTPFPMAANVSSRVCLGCGLPVESNVEALNSDLNAM